MAGRRQGRERREPVLDTTPMSGLRLSPEDRAAGPSGGSRFSRNAGGEAFSDHFDEAEDDLIPARRKSPNRRQGRGASRARRRFGVGRLFYWLVVLAIWGGIGAAGLVAYEVTQLPPIQNLAIPERPPTVTILAADGSTIATRGDMRGAAVPIKALPAYLPQAFVAIEDRRFYGHFGVDPLGLARAMVTNLTSGRLREGGSTLTQQLAKNLFLTQERTLSRKIQEAILAIWLERKYSKNEILELYINRVYFGAGAYGVEAAAQRYFGKPAKQVTLAEAAMLAGLVKSPSTLAPTRNLKGAQDRAEIVLAAMREAGFITAEAQKTALARPATVAKTASSTFAGYAADWVMDELGRLLGPVEHDAVVQTTLDRAVQASAEKGLADVLAKSGGKYGVEQGAVVVMDMTGGVRALVGGRSYEESQFNRAITAKRQPGSAFKAFVYLAALERGLTPDSIREDAPVNLKGWKPENYSREYRGPVSLTTALSLSLNTVAVRLALEVGPAEVVKTAQRLGIASKLDPNPSIALGTSEVSLLELVGAYAPFADGGTSVTPHVIQQVKDSKGKVLYAYAAPAGSQQVVAPPHLAMMNHMLQETVISGTAKRADLPGWPIAGKTGTSQDWRDAWFVGYSGRYIAGVWLGNDDASPTKKASGGTLPVDIWSRVMKTAHEGLPPVVLPGTSAYGTAVAERAPGEAPDEPAFTGGPAPAQGSYPLPPGTVGAGRSTPAAAPSPGLDDWLMDKLFGKS
ncbi:penicillin-binding protein 1A [Ancylobacter sp. 6x-1]|uniref:peptidoglycan glycosyltransferase n=1 Tax=Ancylobacter crimeensis TaxID=2579147 RepID=A0ABT0D7V7_9HYPH|nr:penicillin-binding protein 1A [Ancylobacter crimeensis]MCK0196028.1 penicillin-binding protein 1A [Ancylobacter crimeensis]